MNKDNDILKWFNGDISTEDIQKLYPEEDFSVLNKAAYYSKQMEVPLVDKQDALLNFKKRTLKKETPKVIALNFKSLLKFAAVLIVMLSLSYVFLFDSKEVMRTSIAQTETLQLPDDSEVILNAKSKLSYDAKDWNTNRILNLEGEAFFRVSKGKTFRVHTEAGTVEVLGTQFNVKERINYFEVKCYEGSVSVNYKNNTKVLHPGKTFRIVKGEEVVVKDFKTTKPSWLDRESTFDNVPLWQVINELETQYDMSINTKDIDLLALFTGSFTHDDKNVALQSVTIPLKLSYTITGKNVEFFKYESN